MKTIQSEGGPLIGIDCTHLHRWTGIEGKGFIGEASPFATDYDAICSLLDERIHDPCCIFKLKGIIASGFLIVEPWETAILDIDQSAIYIAQIICGDQNWTFDSVKKEYFDDAIYDEDDSFTFFSLSCKYMLFDSSYSGQKVGDDFLYFDLDSGKYSISSEIHESDDGTKLILVKITKIGDYLRRE